MNVSFQVCTNIHGEEDISFIGDNNEDLCFIPTRLLYRIDYDYRVLDKFEIGDVLHNIIELYKQEWATIDLLNDLTKHIQKTCNGISDNIFADTYRAINEFRKIEALVDDFLKENPKQEFSIENSEKYYDWKRKYKKHIRDNYLSNQTDKT